MSSRPVQTQRPPAEPQNLPIENFLATVLPVWHLNSSTNSSLTLKTCFDSGNSKL